MLVAARGRLAREGARGSRARPPGLLGPAEPGQVVGEPFGRDPGEAPQEALEPLVQGVDHAQRAGGLVGGPGLVGSRCVLSSRIEQKGHWELGRVRTVCARRF